MESATGPSEAPLPRPGSRRRFGTFELDVASGELYDRGRKVRLQEQPFKVLARLTREPGIVVTRDELRRELWPGDTFVGFEHGLNEAVNRLRRTLRDSAERPRFIETLPKRGYRFVLPVEDVPTAPVFPLPAASRTEPITLGGDAAPAQATPIRRTWPIRPLVAGLVALAAAATGAWWLTSAGEASREIRALAVLPFSNLSSERTHDYLADGFTEELTTALASGGGPRVTSRTSALRYKDSATPLSEVADNLKVDAVVEGSIRVADGRVRVTSQLLWAATDETLWTGSYERPLSDVLGLQRDVAAAIASELRMELRAAPGRFPPGSDAVHAYLKGRYQLNRRTPDAFSSATEFFRQANAIDPSYAAPHAGLAEAFALMGIYNLSPPRDVMPKAQAAARRALEIDPAMAAAHVTLALVAFMYDWDWAGAEREFQAALKADASYAGASQSYGVFLAAMARHAEAERALSRALELDPLSLSAADSLAWFRYTRGDYTGAAKGYTELLTLDPTFGLAHRFLGLVKLRQGDHAGARVALARAAELLGTSTEPEVDLAVAFAVAGETARAEAALDALLAARERGRYVAALLMAGLFESLDRRADALAELERAGQERVPTLVTIGIDPLFAAMRAEPRFQQLLARIGLPAAGR